VKLRQTSRGSFDETANETWRMWLLTGVRREPVDRRRIRGSHVGLKRMLVEGMKVRIDRPYTWKEFSDAMVRQSVGEAMHSMPRDDAQLVKLAYFGGMTNREIALNLDVGEATVERRLRHAIDVISRYIERGRGLGQRVLAAVAVWLSGRWLSDALQQVAPATVVAAAAAVLLIPAGDSTAAAQTARHPHAAAPAPAVTHPVAVPTGAVPMTPRSSAPDTPTTVEPVAPVIPQAPQTPVAPAQVPQVKPPAVHVPAVHIPPPPELPKIKKIL
jgi:hypothetical protein